jgi:hypothetical protein
MNESRDDALIYLVGTYDDLYYAPKSLRKTVTAMRYVANLKKKELEDAIRDATLVRAGLDTAHQAAREKWDKAITKARDAMVLYERRRNAYAAWLREADTRLFIAAIEIGKKKTTTTNPTRQAEVREFETNEEEQEQFMVLAEYHQQAIVDAKQSKKAAAAASKRKRTKE